MIGCELHLIEKHLRENHKNNQCYNLLNHFQLNQRKGAARFGKSDSVGRHLQYIFKKRNPPADKNDNPNGSGRKRAVFSKKLQMSVPGQSHKGIGQKQQSYGHQCFHFFK